jgi:hypothetical protein
VLEGFERPGRVCGPMGRRHVGGSAWAGQRSESQWPMIPSLDLLPFAHVGPVVFRLRGQLYAMRTHGLVPPLIIIPSTTVCGLS